MTAASLPDVPSTDLDIGGMTCAACAGRVERALRAVPGVTDDDVGRGHHLGVRHPRDEQRVVGDVDGLEPGCGRLARAVLRREHPHGRVGEPLERGAQQEPRRVLRRGWRDDDEANIS